MIRINLLKPEKKEVRETPSAPSVEYKEKQKPPYFALIILLALAAIAALYFFQKNELAKEQTLLETAQQEKRSLQHVLTTLNDLEQQKQILERKISIISMLKSRQGNAVIIMDELSKSIPDWVWLSETTYEGSSVRVKGKSMSNNLLADYLSNLKDSAYFTDVDLIQSTQRRVRNSQYLEFSLTARFIAPESQTDESQPETKGEQK